MKTKIEKILQQMCLMDDTFMTVALDGNTEAISHIISTVLQRKVNIVSVITQKTVHNTRGKKIVMDDYGNVYVIETENNPTRAKVPRMQYYSDMVSNIIVQTGTAYSQIKNRTVICLTRGDAAKTGQPVSRSITEWKDTDQGTKPYGQIVYVNVRENRGNDPISVLCRDLVQKDYRKITDPILRESCRKTKEGDRKEVMCDKIRQLQAETRKEERARAAQREKMLKKEVAVAKMEAKKLKFEAERVRQDAEQERNNYLRGMVEAKIPVESISSILHMSVDAVRKQALLLGCVL